MIINIQKNIEISDTCGALFDPQELREAILWYSDKPVARLKTVYMHAKYPAVSIYDVKIHIHRLLMMHWLQRDLERFEYVHHKNGNKLDARKENLEIVWSNSHQSHHNKGRKFTPEHKAKISEANKRRVGIKIKKRHPHITLDKVKSLKDRGLLISEIARFFKCDWSTIKSRLNENPDLLPSPSADAVKDGGM